MALLHYLWSRTAASNSNADSAVNWAEGQSPSSVNDSARAMMASAAGFRDDISGATVTGGTSSSYTLGTYQVFDTLAHLSGQLVAFTPHATNANTVGNECYLNVDGLGIKPIRATLNVALPNGTLIAGTPYVALYNNSDSVFYLQGGFTNPYSIPLAGGMDFWGTTAPNSSFAFPAGQAISRTTYATLFSIMSTTYGSGDGSTTFNLPDKTGRISAMKEASATRLTSTYFGGNSTTMGAVGGSESTTLTAAQIPSITSSASNAISVNSNSSGIVVGSLTGGWREGTGNTFMAIVSGTGAAGTQTSTGNNTINVTSNNTSGNANNNVQPTIVCNYIIRVI